MKMKMTKMLMKMMKTRTIQEILHFEMIVQVANMVVEKQQNAAMDKFESVEMSQN
jgi:hypothetical protein